ncbi:hypothetical protein QQG55_44330 [Brugia pahangi]|uniref:Secreted protein n=1 Tax=Brugia pahangi TaxID=6280 RepID=A0A0N4TKK6_BRUPA|nr:unnamed protein product [Brugia pahangi]
MANRVYIYIFFSAQLHWLVVAQDINNNDGFSPHQKPRTVLPQFYLTFDKYYRMTQPLAHIITAESRVTTVRRVTKIYKGNWVLIIMITRLLPKQEACIRCNNMRQVYASGMQN